MSTAIKAYLIHSERMNLMEAIKLMVDTYWQVLHKILVPAGKTAKFPSQKVWITK